MAGSIVFLLIRLFCASAEQGIESQVCTPDRQPHGTRQQRSTFDPQLNLIANRADGPPEGFEGSISLLGRRHTAIVFNVDR